MQRILSIYDWQKIGEGSQVTVKSDVVGQRKVRLRVNSPTPVQLWLKDTEIDDEFFLARVAGLDEIEFSVVGNYTLIPVGGEVWFDTLDGSPADLSPVDDTSFTRIVERQPPSELEIMERRMMENANRRMEAMLSAFEEVIREKEDSGVSAASNTANAGGKTVKSSDASGSGDGGGSGDEYDASADAGGDGDGKQ